MEREPAQSELFGSKETKRKPQFDAIIVFGQGPIRIIKLKSELSSEEEEIWKKFKSNPRRVEEPPFYAFDYTYITPEERTKLQHTGRFAMRRMGKFNALAAGLALLEEETKELILSGGRTIDEKTKNDLGVHSDLKDEDLDRELKYMARWPSEADLLEDIIVRKYGRHYKLKYGRNIQEAIRKEDHSTNTIENLFLTLDKYPDLWEKKIGLLSSGYHLRRILRIAQFLTLSSREEDEISAQGALEQRALNVRAVKRGYVDLLRTQFPELPNLVKKEIRWTRGLQDPQFIDYWLYAAGNVENPQILQRILDRVMKDKKWSPYVKEAFEKVGLDFKFWNRLDFESVARNDPELYDKFRNKLREIPRTMPPEPT